MQASCKDILVITIQEFLILLELTWTFPITLTYHKSSHVPAIFNPIHKINISAVLFGEI